MLLALENWAVIITTTTQCIREAAASSTRMKFHFSLRHDIYSNKKSNLIELSQQH